MSSRIPQSFIDDLLSRLDIVEVVGTRVDLKKQGKDHIGRCPFHDERTASFSVSEPKQFFYCFGCNATGNAIKFIMDHEHMRFREAVELLSNSAGIQIPSDGNMPKSDESNRAISNDLNKTLAAYRSGISNADNALKFLTECGIGQSTVDKYKVGYSTPESLKVISSLGVEAATAAGLVTASKQGIKHWSHEKIILPISDKRGNTTGFLSQPMGPARPMTSANTAIFNKEASLYGLHESIDATRVTDTVVIVERPLEVLALHSYGIECVLSTLNTPITTTMLETLFKGVSNIVFCFSTNRARVPILDATLSASLPCLKEGRDIAFAILPSKYRNCAAFLKQTNADEFHQLVDTALPTVDMLYKRLIASKDIEKSDKAEWVMTQGNIALSGIPSSLYRRLSIKHFESLQSELIV